LADVRNDIPHPAAMVKLELTEEQREAQLELLEEEKAAESLD
jgi:hypothetical protein